MKQRAYIIIVLMMRPRILMRGQVLPLDHLLNELDVVLVDLGPPIHKHHHVVVGCRVVARGLRDICWESGSGSGRI